MRFFAPHPRAGRRRTPDRGVGLVRVMHRGPLIPRCSATRVFRALRGSAETFASRRRSWGFGTLRRLAPARAVCGRFRRLAPHAVGGLPPRSFSSRDRPSDIVSRTEAGAAPLIAFTHVCRQKDNGRSRKPTSASGYRPRVQSASRLHQRTWRDRSCLGFLASLRCLDTAVPGDTAREPTRSRNPHGPPTFGVRLFSDLLSARGLGCDCR